MSFEDLESFVNQLRAQVTDEQMNSEETVSIGIALEWAANFGAHALEFVTRPEIWNLWTEYLEEWSRENCNGADDHEPPDRESTMVFAQVLSAFSDSVSNANAITLGLTDDEADEIIRYEPPEM